MTRERAKLTLHDDEERRIGNHRDIDFCDSVIDIIYDDFNAELIKLTEMLEELTE